MKYVVITKKHIYIGITVLAAAVALTAGVRFGITRGEKAVSTFSEEQADYEKILDSQLPTGGQKESLADKIKKILGFDLAEPETILDEYSALFEAHSPVPEETAPVPKDTQAPQDTAAPTPEQTAQPPTAVPEPEKVQEVTMEKGMEVQNATSYSVDLNALAKEPLPFALDDSGPQVLIMHTHTTESYSDNSGSSIDASGRTTDENKNVVAVGNVIAEVLKANGISVVHDTTVHDYPSYNKAYTRAMATIKANLEKNPSIKVVLDVHRDALVKSDGTKLKVTTELDGTKVAQVMVVAGSNGTGLSHPDWMDNLTFGAKIQKEANAMYPSLMRKLNLREERFNEHLTKGSLILEIGSNGNTLAEAKEGAKRVADAISKVLLEGK